MSNSVQRMAKAGETVRKLGFCMAVVFAGMLIAFAALVVYVIWYAVANVVSVDSFGVVTLLDGGTSLSQAGCAWHSSWVFRLSFCAESAITSLGASRPLPRRMCGLSVFLHLPLLLTPWFRLLVPMNRSISPLADWSFTSCLIPSLLRFAKALPLMRGRLSAQLSVCLSRRSGVMPRCSKSSLTSLCRRKHELSHHRA